ncbi:unnamed protein product, partial [Trypanosoma congolense IL3000]
MFLTFTIMGDFLRPFLQLLQTTARQGEVIYFEPLEGVLRLRSVSASRTVYLLATVATEHMNGYRYSGKSSAAAGVTLDGVDEARGETSRGGADVECHLPILGKALLSTVLRQGQQLRSLSVHYTDEDCDVGTGDTMRWECIVGDGTVKTFLLQLLDKMPERILISPDAYTFDACAPAKIWGSFLRHLPSSPYVIIQPRRQHLELLVINFSKGAEQEPDSTIVVWPSDLLFMHQKSTANSSIDSDVPLPGKVIDAKPFKQVCMLADQLGMMIRVRSGVEKLPLFVETITAQEVGEVAAGRASAFLSDGPEGSLSDGPVSRLMPLFSPFRVRFSMYISANDIALPEVFGPNNLATASRRSTNSSLTGPRDSSSFVGVCPSPRSTAIATSKPSHGDPKASARSRLPQAAIDHPVAATPVTTIGERVVDSGFNSVAVSPPLRPATLCESTPQEGSEEQVLPSSSHVRDSEARFDVNMGVEQEVAPPCDGLSCAVIKDLHRGVTGGT